MRGGAITMSYDEFMSIPKIPQENPTVMDLETYIFDSVSKAIKDGKYKKYIINEKTLLGEMKKEE